MQHVGDAGGTEMFELIVAGTDMPIRRRSRAVARIARLAAVAVVGVALWGCGGAVPSVPQPAPGAAPGAAPGGADLLIVEVMASEPAPGPGAAFTLSVQVRNDGPERAPATAVRFLRSTDDTITVDDTQVAAADVPELAAGGSAARMVSLSAPATAGAFHYGACVDAVAGETDTGNNCSVAVAVVVGTADPVPPDPASLAPDLTVAEPVASDAHPAAGASFTLSATVVNGGTGSSPATRVVFFRSTDATITVDDAQEAGAEVPALAASGRARASVDVSAPATGGTYYYGACVSAVRGESDGGNNCSSAVTVTVRPPRNPYLRIGSTRVDSGGSGLSDIVYVNQGITISVDVENDGGGVSSATTLRIYVSTSRTVPASDRTEAGTIAIPKLGVAGNFNASKALSAPGTVGTYYYRACVEAVADEPDTPNNCGEVVVLRVHAEAPDFRAFAATVSLILPPSFPYSIKVWVWNVGSIESNTTTLRFYRSSDDSISSGDTELHTAEVPELPLEGASEHSLELTSFGRPDTYYYGACVDAAPHEADTTDNCTSAIRITVQL